MKLRLNIKRIKSKIHGDNVDAECKRIKMVSRVVSGKKPLVLEFVQRTQRKGSCPRLSSSEDERVVDGRVLVACRGRDQILLSYPLQMYISSRSTCLSG